MAQHNEASVEEILESIKKVIARDNRENAQETRRQRQADADEADARTAKAGKDHAATEADEILDLADMELETEVDSDEGTDERFDSLIREEARSAMKENLAALATIAAPGARPQL